MLNIENGSQETQPPEPAQSAAPANGTLIDAGPRRAPGPPETSPGGAIQMPSRADASAALAKKLPIRASAMTIYRVARASLKAGARLLDLELQETQRRSVELLRDGYQGGRNHSADKVGAALVWLRFEAKCRDAAWLASLEHRARVGEIGPQPPNAKAPDAVPKVAVQVVASLASKGVMLSVVDGNIVATMPRLIGEVDRRIVADNRLAILQLLSERVTL